MRSQTILHKLFIFCFSIFFSTFSMANTSAQNDTSYFPDHHYLDNQEVHALTIDAEKTVYVAMKSGIAFKEKNAQTFTMIYTDNNRSVNNIAVDAHGIIYAGTSDGFLIGIKNKSGYHFKLYHDMAVSHDQAGNCYQDDISSVYVDSKGIVYIGAHGLFVIQITHWLGYPDTYSFKRIGLKDQVITALGVDSTELLYAGTNSDGLFVGKRKNIELKTFNGIDSIEFTPVNILMRNHNIVSLFIDANDTVYLGSEDNGLIAANLGYDGFAHHIALDKYHLFTTDSKSYDAIYGRDRIINSIYINKNKTIFLGGALGTDNSTLLWVDHHQHLDFEADTLTSLATSDTLNEKAINCVYEDEETGVLYLGTSHGLLTKDIHSIPALTQVK